MQSGNSHLRPQGKSGMLTVMEGEQIDAHCKYSPVHMYLNSNTIFLFFTSVQHQHIAL